MFTKDCHGYAKMMVLTYKSMHSFFERNTKACIDNNNLHSTVQIKNIS